MIAEHVSPLSQATQEKEAIGSLTDVVRDGVGSVDQPAAGEGEAADGGQTGGGVEDPEVCRECEPESPREEGRVRAVRDPGQPTPEERARRELLHVPFRPWCEHCVKGKAVDDPHSQRAPNESGGDDGVPKVSVDYGFIKLEDAEPRTVLVLKVSGKGPVMARCVTGKGREDPTAIPWHVACLRRLG